MANNLWLVVDGKEKWRWVKGYKNYYKVSTHGRVKTVPRLVKCRAGKYRLCRRRFLSQTPDAFGYPCTTLSKNNIARGWKVHRLVAIAFIPNPKNKPAVNHKDGDRTNNHVENLEWATVKENWDHAVKNGLYDPLDKNFAKGSRNAHSTLTEKQVREIRRKWKHGIKIDVLEKEYPSKRANLYAIIRRASWRHVSG